MNISILNIVTQNIALCMLLRAVAGASPRSRPPLETCQHQTQK